MAPSTLPVGFIPLACPSACSFACVLCRCWCPVHARLHVTSKSGSVLKHFRLVAEGVLPEHQCPQESYSGLRSVLGSRVPFRRIVSLPLERLLSLPWPQPAMEISLDNERKSKCNSTVQRTFLHRISINLAADRPFPMGAWVPQTQLGLVTCYPSLKGVPEQGRKVMRLGFSNQRSP